MPTRMHIRRAYFLEFNPSLWIINIFVLVNGRRTVAAKEMGANVIGSQDDVPWPIH